MLAIESMAYLQKVQGEQRDYDKKLKAWKRDFMKSWNSQKSRFGVTVTVEKPQKPALSSGVQLSNGQIGQKRTRESKAFNIVFDYLMLNADAYELPVRTLAEQLGVSKSTVDNAKQIYREKVLGDST